MVPSRHLFVWHVPIHLQMDEHTKSKLWLQHFATGVEDLTIRRRGALGVLLVRVLAAHNLINADWFSLSDPYAKAQRNCVPFGGRALLG